ncbi:MAG TPA: DUF4388 domain-containing protein [Ktedonobacterales bacterium]|nr:DUF4388 domain-containing protein [Ktedonobacterales bacterium]
MAKSRVTATNRLANVIEVVELGRRTGLLSAERDAAGLEEGEIYFISGHPVYAVLGPLDGRDALNVLVRWGACRFAFDPSAPRPIPNFSGLLPAVDSDGTPYGVSTGYEDSQPPEPTPRHSAPNSGASGNGWGGYGTSAPNMMPGMNQNHSAPNMPNTSAPNMGNSGIWVFSNPPNSPPPPPTSPSGSGAGYRSSPYPPDQQMPRRTPDVRDLNTLVATYSLSRGHRTVLLLANGQHTIVDMARLASKSVEEVYQLLSDLRGYGLIF